MSRDMLIGLCWIVVIAVWVIGAVYNAFAAPPTERRALGLGFWPVGLLLGAAMYLSVKVVPAGAWSPLVLHSGLIAAIGAALLAVGMVFTLWARWVLGTMWSANAVAKEGHQLKTSGPYAVTRHPIYTGLLTMLLGTALLQGLGVFIVALVVGVAAIEIKIYLEERLLLDTLGEPYARYRERVPQLIPGWKRLTGVLGAH